MAFEIGGACPTQITATTSDGRKIYGRYRNGWLSVRDVSDTPERVLIDARIGPIFDGEMGEGQFLALTGCRVALSPDAVAARKAQDAAHTNLVKWIGSQAPRQKIERRETHLTGGAAFYAAEVWASTLETAWSFVDLLKRAFGEDRVLWTTIDSEGPAHRGQIDGFGAIFLDLSMEVLQPERRHRFGEVGEAPPAPGECLIRVQFQGFGRPLFPFGSLGPQERWADTDASVAVAGRREHLGYELLLLHGIFADRDPHALERLGKLDRMFCKTYPEANIGMISLEARGAQAYLWPPRQIDPALLDWVSDDPDRALHIDMLNPLGNRERVAWRPL